MAAAVAGSAGVAYAEFLAGKVHSDNDFGFAPEELPTALYDFQRDLVAWAVRKGRAALFADCGLGKTPMQLAWAEAVARKNDGRVLILTPLAVAHQTIVEAEKFGIEAYRSHAGELPGRVVVTNYQRLHKFNASDFVGLVCDESSILKSFDGATRQAVTEFAKKLPFRLLATATAAPNDYTELGTSSEALGELGLMDMLTKFFRNERGAVVSRSRGGGHGGLYRKSEEWRFKGHAEIPFWRWVCTWARALRKPSDLGYDDSRFVLPPLVETLHGVKARKLREGMLFALPSVGLREQREERRRTIDERCEQLAALATHGDPALVWCHLNAEGNNLARLIHDAVQVSGADDDNEKEAKLLEFARGDVRVLVTKPQIGAWGLNLQHCARVGMFPSHSYEQYYQGIRRCWRFGQTRAVHVDIVATEGEANVLANMQRKAEQATRMFASLVAHMREAQGVDSTVYDQKEQVPQWL